jgi:hypothetical protein
MASEAWTVDGRNLSAYAHDILTHDGLDDTPDLFGDDIPFENRHGDEWNSQKFFGPGRKMVSMLVRNSDPLTGVVPSDIDEQFVNYDKNLDFLTRLFYRPRKQLDVRRTLSDGSVRRAWCQVVTGITPELIGLSSGRIVFDLSLPYSFWEDVNTQNSIKYGNGQHNIAAFQAATAPMQDLQYRITGPYTNPRITVVESGAWVRYNGVIPAGSSILLDSSNMGFTATGFAGSVSLVEHHGDPRWITLYPGLDTTELLIEGAGATAASGVEVIGKRKWLR